MLALTIRLPERRAPPSRTGWTEGELVALEMAVKDTARDSPGGWAYFDFGGDGRQRGSHPARALRRVPRGARARSTTFSCSSIPMLQIALRRDSAGSRLPSARVVRYAIGHKLPSHPGQSRPVIASSSAYRRLGYDAEESAIAPGPPAAPSLASDLLALFLTTLILCVLAPRLAEAQGVTTSAMNGFITSDVGMPLEDAQVVAVHVPSGTEYRTMVTNGRRVQPAQHARRRAVHG